MYKQARTVAGRYEDTSGCALNVAITKTYGGVDPVDPYEIILFYFPDKTKNPEVIHRVVVDRVADKISQGQVRGIHGVGNFTQDRIKDLELIIKPMDFCSASGQVHMNVEVIVKEFR